MAHWRDMQLCSVKLINQYNYDSAFLLCLNIMHAEYVASNKTIVFI